MASLIRHTRMIVAGLGLVVGGLGPVWAATPDPKLTGEERAWIAGHAEIVVAFSDSFPPYSQPGPDGRMVGMDIDYLNLIAERTGLKFKTMIIGEWSRAEEAFRSGGVDILTGLIHTEAREAYTIFPRPYMFAPEVVVTRTDMPYVLDVAQLVDLRVGAVRGVPNEYWDRLRREAPAKVREFENMNAVFDALSRGTIDATVTDTVNAAYTIKSLHLTNLRLGSVLGGLGPSYMGVTRREPVLAAIIDKALATVTAEDRRQIDERWIALDLAPSKWLLAFRLAAALAIVALTVFALAFLHNRRLATELTERRRIQGELEEAHALLARVSEEKSELLRMVAHDLRSPLTGFILGTDLLLLERGADQTGQLKTITEMRGAARQMSQLVEELVDVHALEAGQRSFEWTEVDLRAIVRATVSAMTDTAAQKRIDLQFNPAAPAVSIRSDAGALRQVLDNLISNAVKFSPPGAGVRIDLERGERTVRFRLTDAGPGIGPEDRKVIFQKYGRGSAQPTGGEKSTGLGLWIVERIVTSLHGRVWCESEIGKGATFIVELPLAPPV